MRIFLCLILSAIMTSLLCVSCATQAKTIPTVADLDRNSERFRALAQPQYDELEKRRASGALSKADYEREKASLDYYVQQQAVDASWTAHSLAESDRKASGIPTPDKPIAVPAGGGGEGGTLYRSHNDQYSGGMTGGAAGLGGYQAGGSIIGGGRAF